MTKQCDPARDASKRLNGTELVYISCRLQLGLLLEVGEVGTDKYEWIKLRGARTTAFGTAGVTPCPKDLWERWAKTHQWMQCMREKMLQAFPSEQHAMAAGMANHAQLTGLEPLKGADIPKNRDGEPEIDNAVLRKLGVNAA